MLLLIDAGNTRIKWGIPKDETPALESDNHWCHAGAVVTDALSSLRSDWQGLAVKQVVVSNVAGAALRQALLSALHHTFGEQVEVSWFGSQAQLAGLRNAYRQPEQLGSDRFAAAIGAHALFPGQALIVATCGTATTIDAVSAEGEFVGGMILPGLGVMTAALARNTAQLPHIETAGNSVTAFADNTADAISAGCMQAQVGAIERAVQQYQGQQHGHVLCVISGGAGSVIASQLAIPHKKVDNLVLIGLHVAALAAAASRDETSLPHS